MQQHPDIWKAGGGWLPSIVCAGGSTTPIASQAVNEKVGWVIMAMLQIFLVMDVLFFHGSCWLCSNVLDGQKAYTCWVFGQDNVVVHVNVVEGCYYLLPFQPASSSCFALCFASLCSSC